MRAASLALVALVFASTSTAAEPEPAPAITKLAPPGRVALSLATGFATALLPVAITAPLFATAGSDYTRINGSVYAMSTGLSLAPIVSHLVAGEWGRALVFGAVPIASQIAMTVLLQTNPHVTLEGDLDSRWVFGVIFTVSVLSSLGGVVDSALWQDRREAEAEAAAHRASRAARRIAVAPLLSPTTFGLGIGGAL